MSNEGTIVRVDPGTLIVAANVRANTKVTKQFVASVKQHGVLVPITAQDRTDGLAVVDGQRRTLAAIEAGVAEVPVFVVAALDDAARIVDQVVVNDHREQLDTVEQVLAMQELEQLGVSAAAIAKRTGTDRKVVDGAIAVGASSAATTAMREQQLSFDAAIAVAEFEDDPEVQAKIVRSNGSSYVVREAREARAKAAFAASLEAEGLRVIERPSYNSSDPLTVDMLFTGPKLSESLGSLPHEELVKRAGDGLRAFVDWEWKDGERIPEAGYAVAGWKARGFHTHEYNTRAAAADQTPEEKAALKEQRRRDRERTKAWVTATGVRVEWLQGLVQRKTMPKGWELLSVERSLADTNGYPWGMVLTVLRVDRSEGRLGKYDIDHYLAAHPNRAPHIALALALGSMEGRHEFDRKGWQPYYQSKPYLELLVSWGYELSDVEREVVTQGASA